MAGNILTPSEIWGNFSINSTPTEEVIKEEKIKDILVRRVYVSGRTTDKGQVKIYCIIAHNIQIAVMPAIMVFDSKVSEEKIIELAKLGYYVIAVDLKGKSDNDYYTLYPEDISYANCTCLDDELIDFEGNVTSTLWYEWGVVAKYVYAYVKAQKCIDGIGAIGVGLSATPLWHLVTTEKLNASVFIMNAGWFAYKGLFKFSGQPEPPFSENLYKYIAGVEPQTYAKNVKCPTLILGATNDIRYDCDRLYDTASRISDRIYKAVNYSVNNARTIVKEDEQDVYTFFEEFLLKKLKTHDLPKEMDLDCAVKDGAIQVSVKADTQNLKKIELYYAEEIVNPALRTWNSVSDCVFDGKKYNFTVLPDKNSGIAIMFAKGEYENGFRICTQIIAKRFTPEEINCNKKLNVLYSSRNKNNASIFASGNLVNHYVTGNISNEIKVKRGPMDIDGVCVKEGIFTFKTNTKFDKPNDYSILMFDIFSKNDVNFTVKLYNDYPENSTQFSFNVRVKGGDIWHNYTADIGKFKSEEGRILKSFENIKAIEFCCDGECLINNILWL